MENWLEDLINSYLKSMTAEQLTHFKQCAIKLTGTDDIIEAFDKHNYSDFIQLGILDYEEIQLLDLITDEIEYMKEDEELEEDEGSNITEYEELKERLSNRGISLVDYPIHGDSGMPTISLYFDDNINRWVYQKPIERSNRVSQKEFDTFEDARKHIENILELLERGLIK